MVLFCKHEEKVQKSSKNNPTTVMKMTKKTKCITLIAIDTREKKEDGGSLTHYANNKDLFGKSGAKPPKRKP